MPEKKSTATRSRTPSRQSRLGAERRRARARRQTAILIAAVVAIALLIVGVIALASRNDPRSGQVSMDKSQGAATAPVVIVEYADFQCPYCKQFAEGPEVQLKKDYIDTGKARLAYRHFAFIGNESTWAAEASECANEQNRFWDYHDKLFASQGAENSGAFTRDKLKKLAADLGLETTQFNQCLDSDKYRSKVQQEIHDAQLLGLNSTPSILVNGKLVASGSDYATLKAAIDAALAQK